MRYISTERYSLPSRLVAPCTVLLALALGFGTKSTWGQYQHEEQTGQQKTGQQKTGQQKTAAAPDHRFAMEAASGGMAEVKLGKLAQEKANSQKVKEFGQKMVDDHSKAAEDLKSVAQQQGLKLPDEMSKQDQATYNRLSKLQGEQFDRAYERTMLTDHQKDIAAFEKEANNGRNEALKQYAARTLPTLKEHLKEARQMGRTSTSASM